MPIKTHADESVLAVGVEIEEIDTPDAFAFPDVIRCDHCCVSYEAHDEEMAETRARHVAAGWQDPEAPDVLQRSIDLMREYLDKYGSAEPGFIAGDRI